jgi:hypothetical protein
MRMTTFWILLIALALPLACNRAQETAEDAASIAGEAADEMGATARDAADAAADAAAEAREAASEAAAAASAAAADAKEAVSDAADSAAEAASALVDDPVARCSELAAQGAWGEALDVCTKAHEAEPDNMAVEHALQQAKAAAPE